jgi:prevent-host-death family protein
VSEVSISELHDHPGAVIDRAAAGEHITITRRGRPVVELVPAERRRALTAEEFIVRSRRLPPIDAEQLRADIDAALDPDMWRM